MDDQMANGRITNSDIDRRVGHLETTVGEQGDRLHELGNELTVVKLQVQHSQELMRSKFEQVIAATTTTSEQLARVIERLDDDSRGFHELSASPAGRHADKRISDIEDGRRQDVARIKRLEDRILQAVAVLAFLAFLAPLLAPMIGGWIGLPTQ